MLNANSDSRRSLDIVLVAVGVLTAMFVVAALTRTPAASPATTVSRPVPSFAVEPAERPELLAVIGDSWTGASGTDAPRSSWPHLVVRSTGMSLEVLGKGGTGYSTDDPYGDRVPQLVSLAPDVVVVQGSINDKGPPGPTQAAATATLGALKAALPTARIFAVGPAMTPGMNVNPSDVTDSRGAVRAASASTGVTFVDPLEPAWLPLDGDLWSDPYHLNQAGHQLFADHVAAAIAPTPAAP